MTAEWRALDAKKLKKYQDLAAKDKERYEEEMKSHNLGKKSAPVKKVEKDPNEKGPRSAYLIFSAERRE